MVNSISIDITPDKTLIKKLGLIGYRTEQAIAELIDNSVDARIDGIKEKILVVLDFENNRIEISDDGIGMNKQDITDALIIARGTKTEDKLGQFGIGMKSACSSLGKKFKIITSKINSTKEYSAEYDEDEWLANSSLSWRNFKISEHDLDSTKRWHGTKIIIEKLKVSLYPNQVSNFKESFGIRYAPYISTNQIELQINTKICTTIEPDIEKGSKVDINIRLSDNVVVKGYIALLKKRSIKGSYGMHLFKNGRLIKAYEKFGFTQHPAIAKIIGELNLDHVPVNFQKSAFIEDSPEYIAVENAFKHNPELQRLLKESREKEQQKESTVSSVFNYIAGKGKPSILDSRISTKFAKELLDNADEINLKAEKMPILVTFSNEGNALYTIKLSDKKLLVTINRNSPVFNYVKNPLMLIGLIAIEVQLIAKSPKLYDDFIITRNTKWFQFIEEWTKKESSERERTVSVPILPNYRLSNDLVRIHDELKEQCKYKFQFTALSTLADFMHNILGKRIYMIYTIPGRGEHLANLLSKVAHEEFVVIINPSSDEVKIVLDIEKNKKFIIIREYAEITGSTIASPEKAWVDLVNEIYTHKIPVGDKELVLILENLIRRNPINIDKILFFAKHNKKLDKIKPIIERL